MAYEKLFNEIYAIVSLKYFWPDYQPGFVKSESPDWINAQMDLGIEVSQALLPDDGETESFIEEHLGTRREDLPPSAFERYGDRLYFYNGRLWAVLDEEPGNDDFTAKILYRFEKKLLKLNTNYRRLGRNCLYLFAHSDRETEEDLRQILREMQAIQGDKAVRFDTVFIEFERTLYVLDPAANTLTAAEVPAKAKDFMNAETELLRHAAPWPDGAAFDRH